VGLWNVGGFYTTDTAISLWRFYTNIYLIGTVKITVMLP
jgi:hypothetical protein